jgi:hypothetical protein
MGPLNARRFAATSLTAGRLAYARRLLDSELYDRNVRLGQDRSRRFTLVIIVRMAKHPIQLLGNTNVERLSAYLENESPRCTVIVLGTFFEEWLKSILGTKKAFKKLIDLGADFGLLSPNERVDLHVLRKLRNGFAHELARRDFNADDDAKVEGLKLWQTQVPTGSVSQIESKDTRTKLVYVMGTIAFRIQRRTKSAKKTGPCAEPTVMDFAEWPPVVAH